MIEHRAGPLSPVLARALADLQFRAYGAIGMRPWSAEEFCDLTVSPDTHLLIARDEARRAQGFVMLRAWNGEGEIIALAVDPDHQGRGVATKLLRAFEHSNPVIELHRLVLEVAATNVSAKAVYASLSFRDIAVRRNYYRIGGKRVDARVMERRYP